METNGIVLLLMALILVVLFLWGFRTLPKEGWQVMACIPREKTGNGSWRGLNLTYYGFFNASAYVLSVLLLMVLLLSLQVSPAYIFMLATCGLGICVPASRLVAYWVEGKRHTFTVGGAAFVGILLIPWIAWMLDAWFWEFLGGHVPVLTAMAAMAIAYSMGEGIGRLACISFGCCYGKPLCNVHPLLKKIFEKRHFVFSGKTKKIAYAHGLDGQPVVPIQTLTSFIFSGSALLGSYLFLQGHHAAALLSSLMISQVWRLLSEFLRADYRGDRLFSAYQMMAVASIGYALFLTLVFPAPEIRSAGIMLGLKAIWHPAVILSLQALWVAIYLYTGRSQVTACNLSLHVVKEKI